MAVLGFGEPIYMTVRIAQARDRYRTAFDATEASREALCRSGEQLSLRVVVGSLQVDVPGAYFREQPSRRRWMEMSRFRLVHTPMHRTGGADIGSEQGFDHTP